MAREFRVLARDVGLKLQVFLLSSVFWACHTNPMRQGRLIEALPGYNGNYPPAIPLNPEP